MNRVLRWVSIWLLAVMVLLVVATTIVVAARDARSSQVHPDYISIVTERALTGESKPWTVLP